MTIASGINLETNETYVFDIENAASSKGEYQGTWDASTNTPFLTNGVGTEGDWYEVAVGGTVDFGDGDIVFVVGDNVIYNNGTWQRGSNDIIDDNQISLNKTWSSSKINEVVSLASGALKEDIVANIAVGGVTVGQTLQEGMDFTDFAKALLVKYYAPTISMSSNKTLLNKKGTTIAQPIEIRATSAKKTDNIVKTAIIFGGEEVATGTNPSGETVTYTYTTNISQDTTFNASVTDGKQTPTASLKFEFINPFYWGVSSTNTLTDFTGLSEHLEKKGNKTVTVSPNNQYVVFAYDSTYGALSKIVDQNGFDNTNSFTSSTMTVGGQNYRIYVSNTTITKTNFKYTFNF